jgi:hypothetical protein
MLFQALYIRMADVIRIDNCRLSKRVTRMPGAFSVRNFVKTGQII